MEQRRDSSEHTYFDEPPLSRIPLNDRSKVHSYERNWTTSLLFASFASCRLIILVTHATPIKWNNMSARNPKLNLFIRSFFIGARYIKYMKIFNNIKILKYLSPFFKWIPFDSENYQFFQIISKKNFENFILSDF